MRLSTLVSGRGVGDWPGDTRFTGLIWRPNLGHPDLGRKRGLGSDLSDRYRIPANSAACEPVDLSFIHPASIRVHPQIAVRFECAFRTPEIRLPFRVNVHLRWHLILFGTALGSRGRAVLVPRVARSLSSASFAPGFFNPSEPPRVFLDHCLCCRVFLVVPCLFVFLVVSCASAVFGLCRFLRNVRP